MMISLRWEENLNGHTSASVCLFAQRRLPWQIVEEIFALLAIETFSVMGTFATTMHHVDFVRNTIQWQTTRCVTIARTRTTHDHTRNGVVVFFLQTKSQFFYIKLSFKQRQGQCHPRLTWISRRSSSSVSPKLCSFVKLIRKLVIFSKFWMCLAYGFSTFFECSNTRKINSPFFDGSTAE